MTTISVTLSPDLARFVEMAVADGSFASAEHAAQVALIMMRDKAGLAAARSVHLRSEIELGLRDLEAGALSSRSIMEIAGDVIREGQGVSSAYKAS